jgi:hypothetical protein
MKTSDDASDLVRTAAARSKLTRRSQRRRKRSRGQASRSASQRGRPKKPKPSCIVPDCGRHRYARGLCQTHHRQLRTTGELKEIRPYRKRTDGTVKFAGLRLSPSCVGTVEAFANEKGLSHGAAISAILEDWVANRSK